MPRSNNDRFACQQGLEQLTKVMFADMIRQKFQSRLLMSKFDSKQQFV